MKALLRACCNQEGWLTTSSSGAQGGGTHAHHPEGSFPTIWAGIVAAQFFAVRQKSCKMVRTSQRAGRA